MRFRFLAPVFAALALQWLLPQTLLAWGAHGHQITARIAAKHLTSAARSKVFELLKDDPKAKAILKNRSPNDTDAIADAMSAVAMFADTIKNTTAQETREWHFQDLAKVDGSAEAARRCPGDDCVTVRLRQLLDGLKNGVPLQTSNNTFRATAQLKFAIHFFGDIHQPLHCATNADAGGNCLKTEPDFSANQLHATWDNGLVDILFRDEHGHALTELQVARAINQRFGGRFAEIVQKSDSLEIALSSRTTRPLKRSTGRSWRQAWCLFFHSRASAQSAVPHPYRLRNSKTWSPSTSGSFTMKRRSTRLPSSSPKGDSGWPVL